MTNRFGFKEGDWCFYEFQLCQITSSENGHVGDVSNGSVTFGGSGHDSECYPLTMKNKRISDAFMYYYDKLRAANSHLNFPDIHHYFIQKWRQCLNTPEAVISDSFIDENIIEIMKFTDDVIKASRDNIVINAIKIFR